MRSVIRLIAAEGAESHWNQWVSHGYVSPAQGLVGAATRRSRVRFVYHVVGGRFVSLSDSLFDDLVVRMSATVGSVNGKLWQAFGHTTQVASCLILFCFVDYCHVVLGGLPRRQHLRLVSFKLWMQKGNTRMITLPYLPGSPIL